MRRQPGQALAAASQARQAPSQRTTPTTCAMPRCRCGWASGALPTEVAARAGHSVRVLLTFYAHCIPGRDQIASHQIEQALRPQPVAPSWPTTIRTKSRQSRPSYVRAAAGPNGTQLDLTPPSRSDETSVTCGNTGRADQAHRIAGPDGRPRQSSRATPLTRTDLAHN